MSWNKDEKIGWFIENGAKLHGFGVHHPDNKVGGLYENGLLRVQDQPIKQYDENNEFIAENFTAILAHIKLNPL